MEDSPKPTRRWYRFSLRTMLVLVTLLCVYLGWVINWKRQRHEFLLRSDVISSVEVFGTHSGPQRRSAPLVLRLLSEEGIVMLAIAPDSGRVSDYTRQKARSLFPESEIYIYREDGKLDAILISGGFESITRVATQD